MPFIRNSLIKITVDPKLDLLDSITFDFYLLCRFLVTSQKFKQFADFLHYKQNAISNILRKFHVDRLIHYKAFAVLTFGKFCILILGGYNRGRQNAHQPVSHITL